MRNLTAKILAFILSFTLLGGCATSPTGRSQLKFFPSDQMATLGADSFAQLKTQTPVNTDKKVNAYVACVADAITAQLPAQYQAQTWEVVVFDSEDINAFAVPGGKIGVYTGLLKVAKNQDEVAAVIGHEVAHVLAEHSNERMSMQVAGQAAMAGVTLAIGANQSSTDRQLILSALGLGLQFGLVLPYSRTHESEADAMGLDLMAKAGFQPQAAIQLWHHMAAASEGAPLEFMSTHPSHETRIHQLTAAQAQAQNLYQQARQQGLKPQCRAPKI